jgi:hypothetical protein
MNAIPRAVWICLGTQMLRHMNAMRRTSCILRTSGDKNLYIKDATGAINRHMAIHLGRPMTSLPAWRQRPPPPPRRRCHPRRGSDLIPGISAAARPKWDRRHGAVQPGYFDLALSSSDQKSHFCQVAGEAHPGPFPPNEGAAEPAGVQTTLLLRRTSFDFAATWPTEIDEGSKRLPYSCDTPALLSPTQVAPYLKELIIVCFSFIYSNYGHNKPF